MMTSNRLAAGLVLAAGGAALLAGCDNSPKFSVEGTVDGAGSRSMLLERLDGDAGWVAIDSVRIASDGSFSVSSAAPEVPEMYRLALAGKYVYLPVDSVDALVLKTNYKSFDTDFVLSGTPQAEQLTAFEKEAARVGAYNSPDSLDAFRKRVYMKYLHNGKGSILTYYILTRRMGDRYLVEFTDPEYAAVATAFATYRPDDPHTKALVERARQGQAERRKAAGQRQVIKARESAMIEISLPGVGGGEVSLSSRLGKGKPVVVAFSALTLEGAPALNLELTRLYDSGRADIYQVCMDADQYAWRQAAKALPWAVVYDPDGLRGINALQYNVGSVPAFFIYNAAGELVQSTGDIKQVPALLDS